MDKNVADRGLIPLAVIVGSPLCYPDTLRRGIYRLALRQPPRLDRRALACVSIPTEWQERLFRPAAKVESALSGQEIETAHRTN